MFYPVETKIDPLTKTPSAKKYQKPEASQTPKVSTLGATTKKAKKCPNPHNWLSATNSNQTAKPTHLITYPPWKKWRGLVKWQILKKMPLMAIAIRNMLSWVRNFRHSRMANSLEVGSTLSSKCSISKSTKTKYRKTSNYRQIHCTSPERSKRNPHLRNQQSANPSTTLSICSKKYRTSHKIPSTLVRTYSPAVLCTVLARTSCATTCKTSSDPTPLL